MYKAIIFTSDKRETIITALESKHKSYYEEMYEAPLGRYIKDYNEVQEIKTKRITYDYIGWRYSDGALLYRRRK